jgi:purine-cytosine permease-like protein
VLVNYVSVVVNAVNIALTLALTFYTFRMKQIFRGGALTRTRPIFVWAAFFLFLAAVFRAALIWGYFTADFEPLELGTRTVGFILLFAFAFSYFRALASIRNELYPT